MILMKEINLFDRLYYIMPKRGEFIMANRLRRSGTNFMVVGVCGGLAEYIGWDPTLVRLLYVLIALFSAAFPGILFYLLAWWIIPEN